MTPEDRAAALAAAIRARAARAELCAQVKSGELGLTEVLARVPVDEAIAKLKVTVLLQSMPGIGQAKADTLLQRLGIAPSRRLRGLGPNQVAALRREFPS